MRVGDKNVSEQCESLDIELTTAAGTPVRALIQVSHFSRFESVGGAQVALLVHRASSMAPSHPSTQVSGPAHAQTPGCKLPREAAEVAVPHVMVPDRYAVILPLSAHAGEEPTYSNGSFPSSPRGRRAGSSTRPLLV